MRDTKTEEYTRVAVPAGENVLYLGLRKRQVRLS